MLSFLTYIIFTLVIETFALKKFMSFNWKKAVSMCAAINIVAFITSQIAQSYVANKLDPSYFYIFNISENYFKFVVIFISISFAVRIATEAFLCKFFAKEICLQRVLIVVFIMNVITFFPYAIESSITSKTKISMPFSLVESASWLNSDNGEIAFVNPFEKNIFKFALNNSTNLLKISDAMPINGFKISKDKSSAMVLGATNSVTISPLAVFNLPAKTFNFVPAITNPNHIALSSDLKWFAVQGKEKIKIYTFPDGKETNAPTLETSSDLFKNPNVWYYKNYNKLTNTFFCNSSTVTVFKTGGISFLENGFTNNFSVSGMGKFRPFHGIGFTDNEETFLFEFGYELMGLNLKTKYVGHIADGIGGVLLK